MAPFFDIPKVELESVFNAVGRVVSGDVHLRCAALVRTSTFLCAIFANVECRMSNVGPNLTHVIVDDDVIKGD